MPRVHPSVFRAINEFFGPGIVLIFILVMVVGAICFSGFARIPAIGDEKSVKKEDVETAQILSVIGILAGGLSFFLLPILFGLAGVGFGAAALSKGTKVGLYGLGLGAVGLILQIYLVLEYY